MTTIKKQEYFPPQIERIALDNEISLQLESTMDLPPTGPYEGLSKAPDCLNNDPFKDC